MANDDSATFFFDTNIESIVERIEKGLLEVQREANKDLGKDAKFTTNLPRDIKFLVDQARLGVGQINAEFKKLDTLGHNPGESLTKAYQTAIADLTRNIARLNSGRGLTAEIGLKFAEAPLKAFIKDVQANLDKAQFTRITNFGSRRLDSSPDRSAFVDQFNSSGLSQANNKKYAAYVRRVTNGLARTAASQERQADQGAQGSKALDEQLKARDKAVAATKKVATATEAEADSAQAAARSAAQVADNRAGQARATAQNTQTVEQSSTKTVAADKRAANAADQVANNRQREATATGTSATRAEAASRQPLTQANRTVSPAFTAQQAVQARAYVKDALANTPLRAGFDSSSLSTRSPNISQPPTSNTPVPVDVVNLPAKDSQALRESANNTRGGSDAGGDSGSTASKGTSEASGAGGKQIVQEPVLEQQVQELLAETRLGRLRQEPTENALRRLPSDLASYTSAAKPANALPPPPPVDPPVPAVRSVLPPVPPTGGKGKKNVLMDAEDGTILGLPGQRAYKVDLLADLQRRQELSEELRHDALVVAQTGDADEDSAQESRATAEERRRLRNELKSQRSAAAGGSGRGGGGGRGGRGGAVPPFDGEDGDQTPNPPKKPRNTDYTRNFDRLTDPNFGGVRRKKFADDVVRITDTYFALLRDQTLEILRRTKTGFTNVIPETPEFAVLDKKRKEQASLRAERAQRKQELADKRADAVKDALAKERAEQDLKDVRQGNLVRLSQSATEPGGLNSNVKTIGGPGGAYVAEITATETRIFQRVKDGFDQIDKASAEFGAQMRRLRAQQKIAGGGGVGGDGTGRPSVLSSFFAGVSSTSFGSTGGLDTRGVIEGIAKSAGVSAKYAVLGSALYALQGALGGAVSEIVDFQDSYTELNIALDQGDLDQNLHFSAAGLNDLGDAATKVGTNVGEAMDLAAGAVRSLGQGSNYSQQQLENFATSFAREATKISVLANTTLADSEGNLKATALGFNIPNETPGRVTDALAGGKALGGANVKDLSQALASSAVAAREAGFNIDESAAVLSQILQETDEGGQLAATRFSKITSIIGGSAGKSAIRDLNGGLASDKQVDTGATIKDQIQQLSAVYDDLNEAQRQQLVNSLGGTANARELIILLQSADKLIKEADKGFTGHGAEEFKKKLKDISKVLLDIQGQVKQIIVGISQTHALDILGGGIILIDKTLGGIRQLINVFNLIPDPIKKALVYLGEALVIFKAITVLARENGVRNFFSGVGEFVAPGRKANQLAIAEFRQKAAAKDAAVKAEQALVSEATGGTTFASLRNSGQRDVLAARGKRTRSITGIDFRSRAEGGDIFAGLRDALRNTVEPFAATRRGVRDERILNLLKRTGDTTQDEKNAKRLSRLGYRGLDAGGRPVLSGDNRTTLLQRALAPKTGDETSLARLAVDRLSALAPPGGFGVRDRLGSAGASSATALRDLRDKIAQIGPALAQQAAATSGAVRGKITDRAEIARLQASQLADAFENNRRRDPQSVNPHLTPSAARQAEFEKYRDDYRLRNEARRLRIEELGGGGRPIRNGLGAAGGALRNTLSTPAQLIRDQARIARLTGAQIADAIQHAARRDSQSVNPNITSLSRQREFDRYDANFRARAAGRQRQIDALRAGPDIRDKLTSSTAALRGRINNFSLSGITSGITSSGAALRDRVTNTSFARLATASIRDAATAAAGGLGTEIARVRQELTKERGPNPAGPDAFKLRSADLLENGAGGERATAGERLRRAGLGVGTSIKTGLGAAAAFIGPETIALAAVLGGAAFYQAVRSIRKAVEDFSTLKDLPTSFNAEDLSEAAKNLRSNAHDLRAASSGIIGRTANYLQDTQAREKATLQDRLASVYEAGATNIKTARDKADRNTSDLNTLASGINLTSNDTLNESLAAMSDSGRSATTQVNTLLQSIENLGTGSLDTGRRLNDVEQARVSATAASLFGKRLKDQQETSLTLATSKAAARAAAGDTQANIKSGAAADSFFDPTGLVKFSRKQDNGLGRLLRRTVSGQANDQFDLAKVDLSKASNVINDATAEYLKGNPDGISTAQGQKDLYALYIKQLTKALPDLKPDQIKLFANFGLGAAKQSLNEIADVDDPTASLAQILDKYGPLAQKAGQDAGLATALSKPGSDYLSQGTALSSSTAYRDYLVRARAASVRTGKATPQILEQFDLEIDSANVGVQNDTVSRQAQKDRANIAQVPSEFTSSRSRAALAQTQRDLVAGGFDPITGKRKTRKVKKLQTVFNDATGRKETKLVTVNEDVGPGIEAGRLSDLQASLAEQAPQVKRDELADKISARRAKIDPRDELGNSKADLQDAKDQRALLKSLSEGAYTGKAKDDADLAVTAAQQAYRKEQIEHAIAARNVDAIPESAIDTATRNLQDSTDRLKALGKDNDQYNAELARNTQARAATAVAADALKSINRQLKIDLTNPVQVACEALKTADDDLKRITEQTRNSKPDVRAEQVGKATLARRQAEANVEAAQFSQFLSNAQTAEQLGTLSHKAFIGLLQGRVDLISAELAQIDNNTTQFQQLTDQKNQLLLAIKSAGDELSGVFNIGDIKIPTLYEVRRAIKERNYGSVYGANNAFSTAGNVTNDNSTRTVVINGAPIQQVMSTLRDMTGITTRTTSTRRTP